MKSNVFTYRLLNLLFYHHDVAATLYTHEVSTLPAGYVELHKYLTWKLSVTATRAPSKETVATFEAGRSVKHLICVLQPPDSS